MGDEPTITHCLAAAFRAAQALARHSDGQQLSAVIGLEKKELTTADDMRTLIVDALTRHDDQLTSEMIRSAAAPRVSALWHVLCAAESESLTAELSRSAPQVVDAIVGRTMVDSASVVIVADTGLSGR